jgi:hypothetical protein
MGVLNRLLHIRLIIYSLLSGIILSDSYFETKILPKDAFILMEYIYK